MIKQISTAVLLGALSVSAEPGNDGEESYCQVGEIMNADLSGCVLDQIQPIEVEMSYTDASSYSESDSE